MTALMVEDASRYLPNQRQVMGRNNEQVIDAIE
jgi:hypothetical protein